MQRARALLLRPVVPTSPSLPFRTLIRRSLIVQTVPDPVKVNSLSDSNSGIIEVKLDRPEVKNAISKEVIKRLRSVLDSIDRDSSANVVLLCSAIPKVFCAGADLKERRLMTSSEVQQFANSLRSTCSSLEALSIPTIAVIEGAALGGGLEMVLACDLRVCGEDAIFGMPETGLAIIPGYVLKPGGREDAIFGMPETGLAIIPGYVLKPGGSKKYFPGSVQLYKAGGTQRLPRTIGRSAAKELILTGRRISAKEAFSMGLVNYCVSRGEAYPKALQIARDINQKGPLAIRMAKQAINKGMDVEMTSAMAVEGECYDQLLNTQDRLEGLAAFAEKRKPQYLGK